MYKCSRECKNVQILVLPGCLSELNEEDFWSQEKMQLIFGLVGGYSKAKSFVCIRGKKIIIKKKKENRGRALPNTLL